MDLDKKLQDFIEAAALRQSEPWNNVPHQPLSVKISGKDPEATEAQAELYAQALAKAGFAEDRPPVILDFDDTDNDAAINTAFEKAKKGVLIIRGMHAPLKITSGQQLLRQMISMRYDLSDGQTVFTGDPEGLEGYFKPIAELRARLPVTAYILTPPETQAEAHRKNMEEWQAAKGDYMRTSHDIDAPAAASFRKHGMKV